MVVYFVIILMMLYQLFEAVTTVKGLSIQSAVEFMVLCKNIIFIILMIDACTGVKREAKHSAVIVHRAVNCNLLWDCRMQLDAFSLQIYHCSSKIQFVMVEFNCNLLSTVNIFGCPYEVFISYSLFEFYSTALQFGNYSIVCVGSVR